MGRLGRLSWLKPWHVAIAAPLLLYAALDRIASLSLYKDGWYDSWEYTTELDRRLGFRLRPGVSNHFSNVPVEVNDDGFRAAEARGQFELKKPGEILIATAGDSTTFGAFSAYEISYPVLLGRAVAASLDKKVRVVNWGVPGYSLFQTVGAIEKMAYLKPDVLIVTVNSFNDRVFVGRPDSYPTFDREFDLARPYQFKGLTSYPLLYWHHNRVLPALAAKAPAPDLRGPLPTPRVPLSQYASLLQRLTQVAARNGTRVILISTGEGVDSPSLEAAIAALGERSWDLALAQLEKVGNQNPALFLPAYHRYHLLGRLGRSEDAEALRREFSKHWAQTVDRYMLDFSFFSGEYLPLLRELAKRANIPLLDFRERLRDAKVRFLDSGHFEASGYRLMARDLTPVVADVLARGAHAPHSYLASERRLAGAPPGPAPDTPTELPPRGPAGAGR